MTSVQETEQALAGAAGDVEQAERDLASGEGSVSAKKLHELRDRFRFADLAAKGARQKADRDRASARLAGLEQIGGEVDRLAGGEAVAALKDALADVARASKRFRDLAREHDDSVRELIAAARDLGAEPMAPAGPRKTSAYVSTRPGTVIHGATAVHLIEGQVLDALGEAMLADPEEFRRTIKPAESLRPHRPGYLFRDLSNGSVHAVDDFGEAHESRVRSGEITLLSDTDIDRWMAGEIG